MRATALLLALTLAASAEDPRITKLREWIAAVDAHRLGEADEPLKRVASWNFDELDRNVKAIDVLINPSSKRTVSRNAFVQSPIQGQLEKLSKDLRARPDIDTFRKRAALFHTDAALLFPAPVIVGNLPPASAGRRSYDTRRVDVMSSDGHIERYQVSSPHWDYARLLLRSLPSTPQRDPIVARWYRAIGSEFILHRKFADAVDHFQSANDVVPDDPDVLYGQACLQEILGAPRIQDYVRIARQTGTNIIGIATPATHFKRAETMLRKALAAKPDFPEAHLRLGRVLAELGSHDEALAQLQQVIDRTGANTALTYYAHLFAGDARLALNHVDDARESYQHALDLFPSAQAAHLGLGAAMRLMGDRQAALAAVLETTTVPPDTRDQSHEPWWNYYDGDEADVVALLEELRAPLREPIK